MNTIYKYTLQRTEGMRKVTKQVVSVPAHAKFLTAQLQNDEICVWAEVDRRQPSVNHTFYLLFTGETIPEGILDHAFYLATIQDDIGLVWHVYYDL